MRLARREVLGGLGASAILAAAPAAARSDDAELATALRAQGSFAERADPLRRFDPARLSPSRAIDLLAVRAGLEVDAKLAELMPGGKTESPYRVPLFAEGGIWQHSHGARAYRLLIERQLGASTDPEVAHRRFEHEIARLAARADALLRRFGLSAGSLGSRYEAFFADSRWHYQDDHGGRDAAVADMNRWLERARSRVAALVGPVPAECVFVRVRRMSSADEAAGRGGYRELPEAGRPGAYFVDLKDIRRRPAWSLASVVHHELLPGHMIQGPMEAAADPHPLRLAYLPAFSEGWATYAEALMANDGAYRADPAAELGHIHWLLFRLARGLADTGIHHRRWSVERARSEVEAVQGVPAYFAAFEPDIARIAREPGLRAAEALSWLTLAGSAKRVRSSAARRAFHQDVLRYGRKPLRLLGSARA